MSKLDLILEDFKKAVFRLKEVLEQQKNEFIRDATIQRFEICFDLCWKTIKTFLEEENNVICVSPKKCFREAHKQGLIDYDNFWIDIADARNRTAHIYSEKMAENVFVILPKALIYFKELLDNLEKERIKLNSGKR